MSEGPLNNPGDGLSGSAANRSAVVAASGGLSAEAQNQRLDAALDQGPEADIWTGRTHVAHFAGRFTLWLLINAVVIFLMVTMSGTGKTMAPSTAFWIGLVVLTVSAVVLGTAPLLAIVGTSYRLTTQRLFIERGILSKTIDQTELMRVDDVRLYKSVVDRVFKLGSVSIVSTDATDREIVVPGIAESEKVAEGIRQRMRRLRNKTLFVEQL